mgnify:CR=1 FL=1
MQRLLKNLDIDWEEALTEIVGDVVGHQGAEMLRSGARYTQDRAGEVGLRQVGLAQVGLFLGGPKEGLIAITFEVVGPATGPTLRVNPMSAVAPGFLRKLFAQPA